MLLAWALVLGLGQNTPARLEVGNLRATLGELGPPRSDWKVPLGDSLHVAFDIRGLATESNGRVRYRVRLEVENAQGEKVFAPEPGEVSLVNLLGGDRVRESVVMRTGLEQAPGKYRLKLTVTDLLARGKEASVAQEFTLLPPSLAIVRVQATHDRLGQSPAPLVGSVGQMLFLNAVVVGFKRDSAKGLGHVQVELTILDDKGKPLASRPAVLTYADVPPGVDYLPVRFDLPLMASGSFRLVLKATDQNAGQSTSLVVPLGVSDGSGKIP
jgi:hypothetical protein